MYKKLSVMFILVFTFIFSGCSCNANDLIEQNQQLIEENKEIEEHNQLYSGVKEILDFYNEITNEGVKSFVLVESKNSLTNKVLYSNGVVVASSGYYYYILADYFALTQNGIVNYRVMDSNANVYDVDLANKYDETSGLILLRVNTKGTNKVSMQTITLGDTSEFVGHISNVEQFNKVQLYTQIKTSTIDYDSTSYNLYNLENITPDKGSSLINSKNELCGIYLSRLNGFISSELLKVLVYSTYELAL